MDLEAELKRRAEQVNQLLDELLPPSDEYPPRIHEAIRYAVFNGGKRLRPILVELSTELVGGRPAQVGEAAAALEFIHCSTLVLDDLPAMDDARLRRGRPACHLVHGEADTILAAVALLMHSFDLVCRNADRLRLRRVRLSRVVRELAQATGSVGMVGGQHMDLAVAGRATDLRTMEYIHSHKTGNLFILALTIGPLLVGADEDELQALGAYAKNLGLAYQVTDDLLDLEASPELVGKDTGRDRTSFLSLVSADEARVLVRELVDTACKALDGFSRRAEPLRSFAAALATRLR